MPEWKERNDERRNSIFDELFERMMDRGTHSLLLAVGKRKHANRIVVAVYSGYMSSCDSQRIVQSRDIRSNFDCPAFYVIGLKARSLTVMVNYYYNVGQVTLLPDIKMSFVKVLASELCRKTM